MTLTFTLDPVVDPSLRDGILALWADVSNAGGAVGFVPPVTPDDIRPSLDKHLAGVADGAADCSSGATRTGRSPRPPSSPTTRTGCSSTGCGPTR